MGYRFIKESDGTAIVVDGFDKGVMPSPLKGIANIQNANISTELGEVMAGYGRVQNTMTSSSTSGSLAFVDSSHVSLSISGANNKFKGQWITVSSSTHTGELANGTYYVLNVSGSNFQLATSYGGSVITGFTTGLTATIALVRVMSLPLAYATETYKSGASAFYRYYVLDSVGLVWMYDTANDVTPANDQQYWVLPLTSINYFGGSTSLPSGIAVLNGWLMVFSGNKIWVKPTVNLDQAYILMTNAYMTSKAINANIHFAYVGHQGRCYYTDGIFIGSIFPDTSVEVSGLPNVQSYASYVAVTTTSTISQLFAGSVPSDGNVTSLRVPVAFFSSTTGSLPSAVSTDVVYYIQYSVVLDNFQVFAASTGGSALDMQTGASGTQYYNTFYPIGTHAGVAGDHTTVFFSPQRLTLPNFETAQCMTEIGNLIIIGGVTNVLYPWNQVEALPTTVIPLAEGDTKQLLTVNQMAYAFTGSKGNIYITDGSNASLVLKVPDYCAGVPGTPETYFEPVFTWGGVAYVRGKVYFGILDERATGLTTNKAGNCGGVWSFIPSQNLYIGQDTGLALRLENQNSYGTYNGYASVIIGKADQTLKSPQYFAGWTADINTGVSSYGIDATEVHPVGTTVVETDLIPVGTVLNKYAPKQLEYKLTTALVAGESVGIKWRKNSTSAWVSAGNVIQPDGATSLSGYFTANFQGAQWVQLQVTLTPLASTSTSYCRLAEIIMR